MVPDANNLISFTIEGPGDIVATDNGDPSDLVFFGSKERSAFSGLALVIIRAKNGEPGNITVTAKSAGLESTMVEIISW